MVYKYKIVTHRIQLEIDGWPFGLLFYHARCSKRHLAVSSWDVLGYYVKLIWTLSTSESSFQLPDNALLFRIISHWHRSRKKEYICLVFLSARECQPRASSDCFCLWLSPLSKSKLPNPKSTPTQEFPNFPKKIDYKLPKISDLRL